MVRAVPLFVFAVSALVLGGCGQADGGSLPGTSVDPEFWSHWGDGQAEINGYALQQPRYGQMRSGEVVLIFVTEDFDLTDAVKSDRGGPGTVPVLKLNEARDFQTGMYDYNAMTSVFVPLDGSLPQGVPAKISFSMQEWCGHVWDQLVIREDGAQHVLHSYFQSEGERSEKLALPELAIFGDTLPIVVRGLVGGLVDAPSLQLAPRLLDLRLQHVPLEWRPVTVRRSGPTSRSVPAGTFSVSTVELTSGDTWSRFHVEDAPPHRLVGWERSDGEVAWLTGSVRRPYWELSGEGQEALRAELGLPARTWPEAIPTSGP